MISSHSLQSCKNTVTFFSTLTIGCLFVCLFLFIFGEICNDQTFLNEKFFCKFHQAIRKSKCLWLNRACQNCAGDAGKVSYRCSCQTGHAVKLWLLWIDDNWKKQIEKCEFLYQFICSVLILLIY